MGLSFTNRTTLFLQYPLRMIWERSIRNYRTPTRNKVFDVIDRLSIEYKKKTEENSVESSSEVKMCVTITDYRTFVDNLSSVIDFIEWYNRYHLSYM